MSIIEKAVDKLEKQGVDLEKSSDDTVKPLDATELEINEPVVDEQITKASEPSDNQDPVVDEPPPTAPAKTEPKSIDLPLARINSLGMVSPDLPRSKIAEEYRVIKRPLLMNIRGEGAAKVENANLILVTSALAGEGKTFSTVNLAMSIAMEQDKTVLLVDADVSKATATRFLGIPDNQIGLIDLLQSQDISIGDAIVQTNIPNLRVLPAGHAHDRSTEILASDNMRAAMLELSSRYADRVIIFDSPPLLNTTQAAVLANLVGQIVFVVSANSTPQGAVTEAIEHIRDDKVIGMVLNKVNHKDVGQYAYGYGYGYGDRGRTEES